jgi:hypothetical protein
MNRLPLLVLVGFAVATAGVQACGGSPANGTTTTNPLGPDGGPSNDGWSDQTNIEAVFEANCSGCHGTQWASCWDVQASASVVESMIAGGAMPRGSVLSPSDKSTVLDWLSAGAPCTGTKPSGGDNDGGIVEGPPIVAGSAIAGHSTAL